MRFKGFERRRIAVGEVEINLRIGGSGPPLLLLHGYPQTHLMWHKLAPDLARSFTVIASDLRGYGDSSKPPGGPDHAGYSKRAMARDQVEVMAALGFARFMVAGHDRGGRVAHRLALDHADRVTKLAVLDIVPTYDLFKGTDQAFATAYFHWFFLIQPFDFPERMIGRDPADYLARIVARWGNDPRVVPPDVMTEYLRCFSDPAAIHASCEDYRAAASIDLDHDGADRERRIECPLLALWGEKGAMHRMYDVLGMWRPRARLVEGRALPCGHFLPEEAPEETLAAMRAFFGG
ncbi:MAG: alpha/beta hydrolase [Alphaproteobacteria bacterium]|nr:alpha/beta hydrolase [Alphaproteobacteria bacterium]